MIWDGNVLPREVLTPHNSTVVLLFILRAMHQGEDCALHYVRFSCMHHFRCCARAFLEALGLFFLFV